MRDSAVRARAWLRIHCSLCIAIGLDQPSNRHKCIVQYFSIRINVEIRPIMAASAAAAWPDFGPCRRCLIVHGKNDTMLARGKHSNPPPSKHNVPPDQALVATIKPNFSRDPIRIWSDFEFDQIAIGFWPDYGRNLAALRPQFGWILTKIQPQSGRRVAGGDP